MRSGDTTMVPSPVMLGARNVARLALVVAAAVAAIASGGSSQQQQPVAVGNYGTSPPSPQAMDPSLALGLWKSSFGAVKLEQDARAGEGYVHGVWVYDRAGQEVVGYFGGALRGNVLEFAWQEPGDGGAPLAGNGYLVFDPYGQRFNGRWWTTARDRMGEWTGWRHDAGAAPPPADDHGGATYGGDDGYVPPPPPTY